MAPKPRPFFGSLKGFAATIVAISAAACLLLAWQPIVLPFAYRPSMAIVTQEPGAAGPDCSIVYGRNPGIRWLPRQLVRSPVSFEEIRALDPDERRIMPVTGSSGPLPDSEATWDLMLRPVPSAQSYAVIYRKPWR